MLPVPEARATGPSPGSSPASTTRGGIRFVVAPAGAGPGLRGLGWRYAQGIGRHHHGDRPAPAFRMSSDGLLGSRVSTTGLSVGWGILGDEHVDPEVAAGLARRSPAALCRHPLSGSLDPCRAEHRNDLSLDSVQAQVKVNNQ